MRIHFAILVLTVTSSVPAMARPTGPRTFCSSHGDSATCKGTVPSCKLCHQGPPTLNAFGLDVADALFADARYTDLSQYDVVMPDAVTAVNDRDSDGDGVSNLEELILGSYPGDAASSYVEPAAPSGEPNAFYDVGNYDPAFALRRVLTTFCGSPPTFADLEDLRGADEPRAHIHDVLSECLTSDYWRHDALHRMADKRIRPLKSIGFDGVIPLADYDWDYRLFSYVMADDHDVRDLLLAQYHVDVDTEGNDDVVEGIIPVPSGSPLDTGGQPLTVDKRAGMITTQWFLMIHTMFSALPRTTAAQAYRAYLGQDIARGEGIMPVEGEPRDVDNRGVTNPDCVQCHSTLDPLAYAFSRYNGVGRLTSSGASDLGATGRFDSGRVPWSDDSVVGGNVVHSLREWAESAANSDLFLRNTGAMLWGAAMGRPPAPSDNATFNGLWPTIADDSYSANRFLHRVVDTDAFGAP